LSSFGIFTFSRITVLCELSELYKPELASALFPVILDHCNRVLKLLLINYISSVFELLRVCLVYYKYNKLFCIHNLVFVAELDLSFTCSVLTKLCIACFEFTFLVLHICSLCLAIPVQPTYDFWPSTHASL
jgi:hypothetical protein